MRLLLREYIALLRESGELDVLVPELLLAMGLRPLTKPAIGPRQFGVDVPAVGKDAEDGQLKLFLFTVKRGDISRSNWNTRTQDVRPTLDEILTSYLRHRVRPEHEQLPKKVVLVTGGELRQDVEPDWIDYKHLHEGPTKHGLIELDFWGADRLALLIEEHMLDEHLFPPESQGLMRKALALLDQNEEAPLFFYQLVERTLFGEGVPSGKGTAARRGQIKALRLLSLCLGVVVQWGLDVENTRPGVLAGERAVLRAWDFLKTNGALKHRGAIQAFGSVYATYLAATRAYARRVQPLCFIPDGLSGYAGRAEPVEAPLRAFETLGILATLGLNYAFLSAASDRPEDRETAHAAAQAVAALIDNNAPARTPLYDGHVVEVALGLLLFAMTDRRRDAAEWISDTAHRMLAGYRIGRYFPIATDRYEDLLDLERDAKEKKELMDLSTLIPTMAEWLAILGLDEEYNDFAKVMSEVFDQTDFQLWFPDDDTEEHLYRTNAAAETGATLSSIQLSATADEARARMRKLLDAQDAFDRMTCNLEGFPHLGLIASRHYRTPVIPAYWQRAHRIADSYKAESGENPDGPKRSESEDSGGGTGL